MFALQNFSNSIICLKGSDYWLLIKNAECWCRLVLYRTAVTYCDCNGCRHFVPRLRQRRRRGWPTANALSSHAHYSPHSRRDRTRGPVHCLAAGRQHGDIEVPSEVWEKYNDGDVTYHVEHGDRSADRDFWNGEYTVIPAECTIDVVKYTRDSLYNL